ncbi:MAG: zinc ribbon domain-containing protein [Candidatus Fimenecus sp.]
MFCENCGENIKDGVKFCPKCGFAIHQSRDIQHNAEPFAVKEDYDPFEEKGSGEIAPVQPTIAPVSTPQQSVNQQDTPPAYAAGPKTETQAPVSAVTYNNASKPVTYAVGTPDITPPKKKKSKVKIILPIISIILVIAIAAGSLIFVKDKERYYKSREIITYYNDGEPETTETRFREDGQIEYYCHSSDEYSSEVKTEYNKKGQLSKLVFYENDYGEINEFKLSVEYEKDGRNYIGTAECETELYGEMSEVTLDITYNSKGEMIDSSIRIDDELVYSLEVDGRTRTEFNGAYKIVTNYNKNGDVAFTEYYHGREDSFEPSFSYEYTYDGKNMIKSEFKDFNGNDEEPLVYVTENKFEKDRLIETKDYRNNEIERFSKLEKNTEDKLELSLYKMEDGKKVYDGYTVSSFEKNKLTKNVAFDKDDEKIYECSYKNERLVEQTNYQNGEIYRQYECEYEKKSLMNYLFG